MESLYLSFYPTNEGLRDTTEANDLMTLAVEFLQKLLFFSDYFWLIVNVIHTLWFQMIRTTKSAVMRMIFHSNASSAGTIFRIQWSQSKAL